MDGRLGWLAQAAWRNPHLRIGEPGRDPPPALTFSLNFERCGARKLATVPGVSKGAAANWNQPREGALTAVH